MNDRNSSVLLFFGLTFLAIAVVFSCTIDRKVSTIINDYCNLPIEKRLALRSVIASRIEPNRIVIECATDG